MPPKAASAASTASTASTALTKKEKASQQKPVAVDPEGDTEHATAPSSSAAAAASTTAASTTAASTTAASTAAASTAAASTATASTTAASTAAASDRDGSSDDATFRQPERSAEGKSLRFRVHGMPVGVVNAVRRAAIAHVPSVAFPYDPTTTAFPAETGVLVRKNTCTLHNEMLGGRLALVPVCMDEDEMERFGEDTSVYAFSLKKKNDTRESVPVTTGDIVVRRRDRDGNLSAPDADLAARLFPACKITGDHILITRLNPSLEGGASSGGASSGGASSSAWAGGATGDEVDVEMAATVNTAHDGGHTRWSPVSTCFYTNTIDPEAADVGFSAYLDRNIAERLDALRQDRAIARRLLDPNRVDDHAGADIDPNDDEAIQEFEEHLSQKAHFEANDKATIKANEKAKADDDRECARLESQLRSSPQFVTEMRARFDALEAKRFFYRDPITGDANRFDFRLDSECGLSAASVVRLAFRALLERLRAIRSAIEHRDAAKVTFGRSADIEGLHHLIIMDEDHTAGNLLHALTYENNFGVAQRRSGEAESVAYTVPHPLERCILFRVKMVNPAASVEAFMDKNLRHAERRVRGYAEEWDRFAETMED